VLSPHNLGIKMFRYSLSISIEIANQIKQICKTEGRSFADVIREALALYIRTKGSL
jgi:predicted DNA-binding protein